MKTTLFSAVLATAAFADAAAIAVQSVGSPQTLNGWTSLGCYSDDPNDRTLSRLVGVGQDISDTQCQSQCASQGFLYAGTEDAGQCYCDNTVNQNSTIQAASDCSMACTADASQSCGNKNRINLFLATPSQKYNIPGWTSYGCITDADNARALTYRMNADRMTPQLCTSLCSNAGHTLAGVEFGEECFCDNYIQNGEGLASSAESCNMPCNGDSTQICGGATRMDLFYVNGSPPTAQPIVQHAIALPSGWSSAGCYTDAVGSRALAHWFTGPNTGMTVEYCVATCANNNYTLAGLEFGDECYCGTTIDNSQGPADDKCNMPCSGDDSETCGGPGRLNLYSSLKSSPKQCSNQGLQYAAYTNPYYNGDGGYSSFSSDYLKTSTRLIYSGVTTTIGGVYDSCNTDASITVYGSSTLIPCTYSTLGHRGYIYAPVTGMYTFSISQVDDIVLFWTGQKAVSGWTRANADAVIVYGENNNCNWPRNWHPGCGTFSFQMTAGEYLPIRIVFGQAQGATSFQLALYAPDGTDLLDSNTPASQNIVQFSCDGTSAPAFPEPFGSET